MAQYERNKSAAVRSFIRRAVDSRAPALGKIYREVRDERARSRRMTTSFGCQLAGPTNLFTGDWEVAETELFKRCLRKSSVCIDIGANVGFYSCLAAARGKQVIAVEPLPGNLKFLYSNLAFNGLWNVEVFPMGLSSSPGLKRLYGTADTASFVRGWGDATEKTLCTVAPVTTLDLICATRFHGLQYTIKMDVEGFELQVLQGALQTLDLDPKPFWLVEILLNDRAVPGGINPTFSDTFEMFWSHGYEARQADDSQALVTPREVRHWVDEGRVPTGTSNFLFTGAGQPNPL